MRGGATYRIDHWPRLTRFYGITPLELQKLPPAVVDIYVEQMGQLRANEQLAAIQACSFPYFKERTQESVFSRLRWLLGMEEDVQKIDVASEEGKVMLGGLGIKVVTD